MFIPKEFAETDPAEIDALIKAFPLAVLVAHAKGGIIANHLPMFVQADGIFIGHIAAINTLHTLIEDGSDVLLIFQGDSAYISPNWYPSKQIHHKHVPTWNYQVVHVHGKIYFSAEKKHTSAAVGRLTKIHEDNLNGKNAKNSWKMAHAPRDYIEKMLDEIVMFRIEPSRIEAVSKLSQNRTQADFENVVQELEKTGNQALAKKMGEIQIEE